MQASQGLQVSALRTPRGKSLVPYGNEKVPKAPLMWRLSGKNVREMLFHPLLVCLSGVHRIPKQKLGFHRTNPALHLGPCPERAGGTRGPRGCAALAALRGAARSCLAFPALLLPHPISDHSVPISAALLSAAAGLRPARVSRRSRTAAPGAAGGGRDTSRRERSRPRRGL